MLNGTQSRKPVGAPDSEGAKQAQEARGAALADANCLHNMMTAERMALGNATVAARTAGVRHHLPEDLEVPLQTPPGFSDAWRKGVETRADRDAQRAHQKRWPQEYHRVVLAHKHKQNRREPRRQPQPWTDNQGQASAVGDAHPRPSPADIAEVREQYRWLGRSRMRGIVRHFTLKGYLPRDLEGRLADDQHWPQSYHDTMPSRSHASAPARHQAEATPKPTTATKKIRGDAPIGRPGAATTPTAQRPLPDHLQRQPAEKSPPPTTDSSTPTTGGSDDAPAAAPSKAPAQGKDASDGAASASDSKEPADMDLDSNANNTAGASPHNADEVDYS